jgi:hypothetical protein
MQKSCHVTQKLANTPFGISSACSHAVAFPQAQLGTLAQFTLT